MRIKRIEKSRKEEIRARAGVANTSEKMREARLRWLDHVVRKTRRCNNENMKVGHQKIGRSKLRWSDVIIIIIINITSMALKSSGARARKRNKTKSVIIFKSRGHIGVIISTKIHEGERSKDGNSMHRPQIRRRRRH